MCFLQQEKGCVQPLLLEADSSEELETGFSGGLC